MSDQPKCFGRPAVCRACIHCGHRIECTEEFNFGNEWMLLALPAHIDISTFSSKESLDPRNIVNNRLFSTSGAKTLLRIANSVNKSTATETAVTKDDKGRIQWHYFDPKRRKFAEIREANAERILIRLAQKSEILETQKLQATLKQNRKKEVENLTFALSIALKERQKTL